MSGTEPTYAELDLWVHMASHLRAEKGRGPYTPDMFVFDCWFFAGALIPDWANELVDQNAPGWQWCPRLNPSLLARTPA